MTQNLNSRGNFLITSREFPTDPDRLTLEIDKSYVDIANAVNARTIGQFPTTRPIVTGESWFISNNLKQQTFRQVYRFGAISPGAELDIPTNITSFQEFTRIYGTVVTNTPDWRPLPYVDSNTLNVGMALLVGPVAGKQQIRIILGAGALPVTSGLVVLEWLSPA